MRNTMAQGSTEDYYVKAFKKLEESQNYTWNWAAFFGGCLWLAYRKMYWYAIIWTCLRSLLLSIKLFFNDQNSLVLILVFVVIDLTFDTVLGRYGNSLYYRMVKLRIERGYHLIKNFHPTSYSSFALILVACLAKRLFYSPNEYCEDIYGVTIVCSILAFADWLGNKYAVSGDRSISEENIRMYLTRSNRNHISGIIASCFVWFLSSIEIYMGFNEKTEAHEESTKIEQKIDTFAKETKSKSSVRISPEINSSKK